MKEREVVKTNQGLGLIFLLLVAGEKGLQIYVYIKDIRTFICSL